MKRIQAGRHLAVSALGSLALLILWGLFLGARGPDIKTQTEASTQMRQLRQHLSELGQQLVLVRQGLLPHYDSINHTQSAIQADIAALRAITTAMRGPTLQAEVARIETLYAEQANQVEAFKSTHAVLKNSLRYLPVAASSLENSLVASGKHTLARQVESLSSQVLIFNLNASPELAGRIRSDADALERALLSIEWKAVGSRVPLHTRLILDHATRLDQHLGHLLAFPIRTALSQIDKEISFNQAAANAQQNRYRYALALYAALLLGLAAYWGYRHKLQTDLFKQQATHDSLTGLCNRAQLHSKIAQAIQQSSDGFALILLDLDRFKEINDALGHQSGDGLLKKIGPRIQARLPKDTCVARLGGDEFAILLPWVKQTDTSMSHAVTLRQALSQPFTLGTMSVEISASLGIAHFPQHGTDASDLLRHADIAMYAAKRGEGCLHYTAELDVHSPRRLAIMTDLRRAIREDQLHLQYQPKVNLRTGETTSVEALLRWTHPTLGVIHPSEFIPLAEMSDVIHPLTRWVVETAARQILAWEKSGLTLNVAVNLSARNLLDESLPQNLQQILDTCGVAPTRMEMEITESAIMADPRRAEGVLNQIDQMGIKLAIDDFGTGYSSLAYLLRLPVDCLKLDRAFVANLRQKGEAAIVRSTVQMAHNLGLSMVAEGAEDVATVAALIRADYDVVQGYYFSRPLSADALQAWLISNQAAALFEAARLASQTAQDLPTNER